MNTYDRNTKYYTHVYMHILTEHIKYMTYFKVNFSNCYKMYLLF